MRGHIKFLQRVFMSRQLIIAVEFYLPFWFLSGIRFHGDTWWWIGAVPIGIIGTFATIVMNSHMREIETQNKQELEMLEAISLQNQGQIDHLIALSRLHAIAHPEEF